MKNKIITFLFIIFIFTFSILNILVPDKQISYSERRKLKQLPVMNINNIMDGSAMDDFDNYANDQFILRDDFRKMKAFFSYHIFHHLDNHSIYVINDHLFKLNYPLNNQNIEISTNKINDISNHMLTKNNTVYYSIIPDKNYYNGSDKYLKINYDDMFDKINHNLNHLNYIDITHLLSLDSFYKTDPHWKQEKLLDVSSFILNYMNIKTRDIDYTYHHYDKFYGAYYNEATINIKPDTLFYVTNDVLDKVKVNDIEDKNLTTIYDKKATSGIDSYDIYLGGSTPLIELVNNDATTDKELVIFRDSFGSSLAPLFIPYYKKITLIDLRYINTNLITNYITFDHQDILFLYSTLIINSNLLK